MGLRKDYSTGIIPWFLKIDVAVVVFGLLACSIGEYLEANRSTAVFQTQ